MFDRQKKGRVVMQRFKVDELIPHPKNDFFFDDMEGQKWQEFLESVRTSGVIEPPVVTSDKVIVSGHQRIRACKELGIEEIYCEVRTYDDEDKVIKDLIETNIRQRGTIAGSELKMGRVWEELKRIYGIRSGTNQYDERSTDNRSTSTRDDLAAKLGKNVSTLNMYSQLDKMIPEFKEILTEGKITATTAGKLICGLSDEEQLALLEKLPTAQKFTQSQIQQYIDQIKGLTKENAELRQEAVEATRAVKAATDSEEYLRMRESLEKEKEKARKYYEDLQAVKKGLCSPNEIKEAVNKAVEATKKEYKKLIDQLQKEVEEARETAAMPEPEVIEVVPDDYEELKRAKAELDAIKNSSDPDISKQILRIHTDDRTPEQKLNSYEKRLIDEVGGFLSIVRGLEVQFDMCPRLPAVTKRLLRESISEIQQILTKMDNAIMEVSEECKTA
jgi:ParB family chromosome partitioning protein